MGATFIILGTSIMAILLAGYLAQHYLPPPKPKIVGIDLGTTYSCVGIYHAVTGHVDVLKTQEDHRCIPSIVAFSEKGVLVGHHAAHQMDHNPKNTIYDAKRFIGKKFSRKELTEVQKRYPFKLKLDEKGMVQFDMAVNDTHMLLYPEQIGSILISTLKEAAEKNLSAPVTKVVLSVPAEFDVMQRNYTKKAAELAGLEVFRTINEPTAAALAYGLHTAPGLRSVLVVDLGGGTLDVSFLNVQGGMFLTQAMAGNNLLGGQDFNLRLYQHLKKEMEAKYKQTLTDKEDLQTIRLVVEETKLHLTDKQIVDISIPLYSLGKPVVYQTSMSRSQFEDINRDLFLKVLEPIITVLKAVELTPEDVDEIVLVGGSTRIPKVRQLIRDFFGKELNTAIDPELAVATGVAVQAGIIGGMWPLKVSAVELPTNVKKIHL